MARTTSSLSEQDVLQEIASLAGQLLVIPGADRGFARLILKLIEGHLQAKQAINEAQVSQLVAELQNLGSAVQSPNYGAPPIPTQVPPPMGTPGGGIGQVPIGETPEGVNSPGTLPNVSSAPQELSRMLSGVGNG
jgi:hypothetical protein